jgi:hypothetical protein
MRVVLAGCFSFVAMLLSVGVLAVLEPKAPAPLVGMLAGGVLVGAAVVAVRLFNPRGVHPLGFKSPEQHVAELQRGGLLMSERFTASRAFGIQEFEDEGIHYFVGLTDGRVLFLSGQYLYDYEPLVDTEGSCPRRFPCGSFTVRWHRTEHYTVDLVCEGVAFEPEVTLPSFTTHDYRAGVIPRDRAVITDRTYDALKEAFSRAGA